MGLPGIHRDLSAEKEPNDSYKCMVSTWNSFGVSRVSPCTTSRLRPMSYDEIAPSCLPRVPLQPVNTGLSLLVRSCRLYPPIYYHTTSPEWLFTGLVDSQDFTRVATKIFCGIPCPAAMPICGGVHRHCCSANMCLPCQEGYLTELWSSMLICLRATIIV